MNTIPYRTIYVLSCIFSVCGSINHFFPSVNLIGFIRGINFISVNRARGFVLIIEPTTCINPILRLRSLRCKYHKMLQEIAYHHACYCAQKMRRSMFTSWPLVTLELSFRGRGPWSRGRFLWVCWIWTNTLFVGWRLWPVIRAALGSKWSGEGGIGFFLLCTMEENILLVFLFSVYFYKCT